MRCSPWVRMFAVPLTLAWQAAASPAQTQLPDQLDLARLVDLSARRLGVAVSYDEASLKGRLTLRSPEGPAGALSDEQLWALTGRALAEQGLTTVRSGDDRTLSVVKLAQAAQAARLERLGDLPAADAASPVRPGFRRVLVPLQRASTRDVSAALQLVLSKPAGSVAESEAAGMLVVADLTPSLDMALELIARMDAEGGAAAVREVPARNVDAPRLATLAKQLAERQKAAGGRELRGDVVAAAGGSGVLIVAPAAAVPAWEAILATVDQREGVERRAYGAAGFGLREVANLLEQTVRAPASGAAGAGGGGDDRWRIVVDELTGTLLVTATPAQHEQVAQTIDRLAAMPAEGRRPVRTFRIRNRAVREVQQVVEDLLRAGALDAGAPGASQATGGAGGGGAMPQPALAAGPQTSIRPGGPADPVGGGGLLERPRVPRV